MQLNLIDYKELTQTAWGRSQHYNEKMVVVFAEGSKCGKDCSLMCSCSQTGNSRGLPIPPCYASCTVYCVSRGGLDKVYIKVDMERGERCSKFGLNDHGTEVELRAQGSRPKDTKKYPRPKTALSRRECSPKSNNNVLKFFFTRFKSLQKFFSGVLKKNKIKKSPKEQIFLQKRSTKF